MKTMTLDEVKKLPPLTKEEINEAMNFKNTDFSDCPVMTKEENQTSIFNNEYSEEESLQKMRETSLSTVLESIKNDSW